MSATLATPKLISHDLPVMYEDEGLEMGESLPHFSTEAILYFGLKAHVERAGLSLFVLPDMNLYYVEDDPAYVSPDVMIVPTADLPDDLTSYRIGRTGPAPILVIEVLSQRTAQQGDLSLKPDLYAE